MNDDSLIQNEFIFYNSSRDGKIKVTLDLQGETVWLTQKQIADIFVVDVRTINGHIQNIIRTGELSEETTIRKFRIVVLEGQIEKIRDILYYNLDMVVSIRYRVRSTIGSHFRRWATDILKEYIAQGFSINSYSKMLVWE